jgi:PPP family 3-phenylpropionic acid transporter
VRLWGSAAFVVGALGCGLLVDVMPSEHLIWAIAAVAGSAHGQSGLEADR